MCNVPLSAPARAGFAERSPGRQLASGAEIELDHGDVAAHGLVRCRVTLEVAESIWPPNSSPATWNTPRGRSASILGADRKAR